MRELTGAVIGITLVLTAVFIPMAFASGSVGAIYRQFTVAMAVSILFSALLAPGLTPALCATLLRQASHGHHGRGGLFGAFNQGFERMTGRYQRGVATVLQRSGRVMGVFAALVAALLLGLHWLPGAFLPEEDQGLFHDLDPAAGRGRRPSVRWPWSKPTNGTWPRVRHRLQPVDPRLQFFRFRPECGADLHHAEGLG